jgi:3-oxoacyl-[acyl-carrier-protein] synthase II
VSGVTFSASNVKTRRVAVVAAGMVSPLGCGMTENLASLRAARDCVTTVTRFSVTQCRCKTAGQVADERLSEDQPKTRHWHQLHRATYMMRRALKETLQDKQFEPQFAVIGTTSGGMSFGEDYYRALVHNGKLRNVPAWIANYTPHKAVTDALQSFGIRVGYQVIANACASGTNAIGHAFECIRAGRYERVLAGGYDALSELVFVGFDSLQAATPEKCRPFDRQRSGMILGEGAAILALEELRSAQARGARPLAEITGYGISTDNHHLTQPDPSGIGPREAMQQALESAGLEPSAIDYINAHGTGTPLNDAAEAKAINDLFDRRVPISSTKSMMGHSLGAAGAIEAAFCILALQNQFLPANINFGSCDDGMDLNVVANVSASAPVRTLISNSFGFGGTNASIVMQQMAG